MTKVGIRREDKNKWERRIPIVPDDIRRIAEEHGIKFVVQPSDIRIFKNDEFKAAGAEMAEDLSSCPVVFAVKEIPIGLLLPNRTYIFFSHTIKGQAYNMPMLKKMMNLGCTLIDYERIVDAQNKRLIFFGRHAGIAGMVDTLWAYGKRCESEGIRTPFSEVKRAYEYDSVDAMKEDIARIGREIALKGLPAGIAPFVCGITGYGNVSKGVQEIFDVLPFKEISPAELLAKTPSPLSKVLYKVVFKEQDMVEPIDPSAKFDLKDYYKYPDKYRGVFEQYLPHFTILMNCIYWAPQYPRLLTKELARRMYAKGENPKLKVIGDISCDIEGSVEVTLKGADPGNPTFVYDVDRDTAVDGWEGRGPVVMAVDTLPCEVPRDSSTDFSGTLRRFVPAIAKADYGEPFEKLDLPPEIKKAVILLGGKLTPDYRYLGKYVR